MSSFLARYPERQARVASLCYFGSKRRVRAWTVERLLKVDLVWGLLCPILIGLFGYLPARRIGIGSSDETAKSFSQCLEWVRNDAWIDSDDGFDYAAGLAAKGLPPRLVHRRQERPGTRPPRRRPPPHGVLGPGASQVQCPIPKGGEPSRL